ncbi:hypothetical protein B0H11DRAFT_2361429 [Mycena galericulata]|nr:hypothetical protein B0H11DRAFT_2361429 [Mycena galericulata]
MAEDSNHIQPVDGTKLKGVEGRSAARHGGRMRSHTSCGRDKVEVSGELWQKTAITYILWTGQSGREVSGELWRKTVTTYDLWMGQSRREDKVEGRSAARQGGRWRSHTACGWVKVEVSGEAWRKTAITYDLWRGQSRREVSGEAWHKTAITYDLWMGQSRREPVEGTKSNGGQWRGRAEDGDHIRSVDGTKLKGDSDQPSWLRLCWGVLSIQTDPVWVTKQILWRAERASCLAAISPAKQRSA